MTITSGVSFLGQSDAQVQRLVRMRTQMDDLSRQIGTQKRYATLTGFGLDTQRILQLHAERDQTQAYSDNIDGALSNIRLMSDSMTKITDSMSKLISLVQSQANNGQYDTTLINSQASQIMDYVSDIANININGRYIFGGTDTDVAPVADKASLKSNFQAQVTSWLSGGTSTNTLLSNTDAFTGTTLGLSSSIGSAQDVTVRIDSSLEISYGAMADRCGIQEALRALGFLSTLKQPDPSTDVPTNAQFTSVIDHVLLTARDAIDQIEVAQGKLSGSLDLAKSIQDTHKQDINLFASQIDKAENIDPAEVIAQLQALQTQLTSSYQVTSILSQLSLANYLS